MACFLPKFILLKSNKRDKCLRYRKEDDSNHAFLQFSGDEKEENIEIQYIKFEVQQSETMEGFVHIRSSYNNKYWVRKCGEDESKSWIAAEANEPEEDPSKLSCTLFKPVLVDSDVEQEGEFVEHDKPQKIRLVHVDQLGQQGCVALADSDLLTLQDGSTEGDVDDVFTAYNAVPVVVFPPHTALMNHMGLYASLTKYVGQTFVNFNTSDIGQEGVVLSTPGALSILPAVYWFMNVQHVPDRWWHIQANNNSKLQLVTVLSNLTGRTQVIPINLGGNNVAFRPGHQVNRFATCVRYDKVQQALSFSATSINESAIFTVHEPVLFRKVSNVEYNLADARVYNISSLDKFKDVRWNYTSEEQTGAFSVEYTTSQTNTWSDSVSITTSISASMSVSIPFVGAGLGVEMSHETNQTVVFGKEELDERVVKYQQDVKIPPGKKITLLVVATRAQCDVPFTCRVVDTLSNGNIANYTKHDGLFTGANEFGFDTKILQEDL